MSKFKIRHVTKYLYQVPVRDSANQFMLYPLKDAHQEVLHQTIKITGDPQVSVYIGIILAMKWVRLPTLSLISNW